MMKNLKINNVFDKILIVFLLVQPIFDIKIFYNSISTLIRVIIIFALFLYYFITSKNKHKYWLFLYPLLLGVYFIFHHLNALSFNSLVPGNFNYSVLKEFLYFVKMSSPFLLIYCIYKSSIDIDCIIGIMKALVLTICLVIVISNFLGFSYGNYSDTFIKGNFFDWFNPNINYTYMDLASKGLFEFGNQITAILIMFLPFMIYNSLEKCSFINYFTLVLNIFGLILLCTRTAILGVFVVFTYTIFSFGFIMLINKQHLRLKKYIPAIVVLVVYSISLPFNPLFNRLQERETVIETFQEYDINSESVNAEIIGKPTVDTTDDKLKLIEAGYENKQIHKEFLFENYPYIYDPEFWYDFLQKDISLTTDYRYTELAMIKRVVEINNNNMDKWFGITNTRLQNIFNIEKDFVVQYYAIGVIGTILVFAPYFILIGIFAYDTIKKKFKNLTVQKLLACITIVFLFGISYMSGNLLNSLSFTIYFTLLFAIINKYRENPRK